MVVWGEGLFDNDDAAEWVYELEEAPDFGVVHAALTAVIEEQGYLRGPQGSIAIAAAEMVAAARERPGRSIPESVALWVELNAPGVGDEDVALALAAVDRVLDANSELRDLWTASGDPSWLRAVEDLRLRLTSIEPE